MKNSNHFVEPDEIFMDSQNIANFDRQQFEGRIEKPISRRTIFSLGIFFVLFASIFILRLGYLQIDKGVIYLKRSENNTLNRQIIFSDRGIIYDRNKVELAWNKKFNETESVPFRSYIYPGFSHLLGYVSYPTKDGSGHYWQEDFIGKDGIEKQYNERLKGINGLKIVEIDALGNIQSENEVDVPERGADLLTTIDSRIQKQLFVFIKSLSERGSFRGGAGVIMEVNTGEIISSTSFPEYDSSILSEGKDDKTIKNYFSDKRNVFMDKNISGLYAPGSIVKPFFALGALNEKLIDPLKKILSTGAIYIANPYFPGKKSEFKDWKAHGWTDMREAIAVSSDVYFYEIGGGFDGQRGLGIGNIEKYSELFGIGDKTGVDLPDEIGGTIPSPEWKAKNFPGDPWRIGDTYHTAIGQYGFQVTPIQMVRAVSAIANSGTLVTPHFILGDTVQEAKVSNIILDPEYFKIVQEGMRQGVTSATGTSIVLNVPYVKVASKTGTAQIGISNNRVNSWVIGFFPYEAPKYAYVLMMESGPTTGIGAVTIMRELLDWMSINTPEYFN